MQEYLTRTSILRTLGAAGIGLGLVVGALGSAPAALAQEDDETPTAEEREGPFAEVGEKREELYADFTAALAEELGIDDADDVDAAIRIAMMSVIDQQAEEGLLTEGQAEAVKVLVATSDVPIGPGFGPHHGGFMVAMHGGGPGFDRGFGPGSGPKHAIIRGILGGEEGHMLPGLGEDRDVIVEWIEERRGEQEDDRGAQESEPADDSQSDADEEEDSSS